MILLSQRDFIDKLGYWPPNRDGLLQYAIRYKYNDIYIDDYAIYQAIIQQVNYNTSNPLCYDSEGRTEKNLPFFSIAGFRFILLDEETANKFKLLK